MFAQEAVEIDAVDPRLPRSARDGPVATIDELREVVVLERIERHPSSLRWPDLVWSHFSRPRFDDFDGRVRAAAAAGFAGIGLYTQAYGRMRDEGRTVIVDFSASWCPTCAKQAPILSKLSADPAFKDLTIFRVDYDTQKDVVRDLGARMQSTLIAFHGAKEAGRSAGETNPDRIRALLEQANR